MEDSAKGMLNSPTICQYFIHQTLLPVWEKLPNSIIYHYVDDILIAAPSSEMLAKISGYLNKAISNAGLIMAPEKVPTA